MTITQELHQALLNTCHVSQEASNLLLSLLNNTSSDSNSVVKLTTTPNFNTDDEELDSSWLNIVETLSNHIPVIIQHTANTQEMLYPFPLEAFNYLNIIISAYMNNNNYYLITGMIGYYGDTASTIPMIMGKGM